mgnify:CR=1 FL=1
MACLQEDLKEEVDFVLTFEELQGIFEAREIDFSKIDAPEDLTDSTALGRGFAAAGGVSAAVLDIIKRNYPDADVRVETADGLKECRTLLALAKAGKMDGCLLEGMACKGGCINGAGTIISADTAKKRLQEHMAQAENESCAEGAYSGLAGHLEKPKA